MSEGVLDRYKRAFFAGLAALLPTILTLFVLFFCYNFIDQQVAGRINHGLRALLSTELRTTWQGPDHRAPPARPERARRKLSLLPAVENPSPACLVTANHSATELEASRLMLHNTIIAARDRELRPRTRATRAENLF